jgi:uncharacterized repeat protein (TIGR03803 family)
MNSKGFLRVARIALPLGGLLIWAVASPVAAQGFKLIHLCDSTDRFPTTLIQAPMPDGHFYGITLAGGTFGYGTIFKMDAAGNMTTLHSFAGPPSDTGGSTGGPLDMGLLLAADGFLYGAAYGSQQPGDFGGVFRIDTSGNNYSVHLQTGPTCDPKGAPPNGSLIQASDGHLYLPMFECGPPPPPVNYSGTIDEVDSNLNEAVDGSFLSFGAFRHPVGHLVEGAGNKLFGVAGAGFGASAYSGAVYSIPLGGGADPVVVHGFAPDGTEGFNPLGPPVLATDGNLYGTTNDIMIGSRDAMTGTIFRVSQGGTFQTMHVFNGADGALPASGLMQASDLNLYGATSSGGTANSGVVYRMDLAGNYTVLASVADVGIGHSPASELLEGTDGKLYGTTTYGGAGLLGSIYTIDLTQKADSITPSSGPAAGGTPVTIGGAGFVAGAAVVIGSASATGVGVPDATHVTATTPSNNPGTLNHVKVVLPDTTTIILNNGWFADFLDVPQADIFHSYVEKVFRNGITAGCGGGNYCRNNAVTRAQMAVFLLKSEHGSDYVPPSCTGVFSDVTCPSTFADWIEQLAVEGITGGCGIGIYCPDSPVTRRQMAVFLLKTEHGSTYTPPACAGLFGDVACPSPFADWIERLYAESVTGGCQTNPLLYCPGASVLRGQMATFLTKTFNLP